MRCAGLAIDDINQDLPVTVGLFNHREVRHDRDRIRSLIAVHSFDEINTGIDLAERNHAAVVFVFQRRQFLAPVLHLLVGIQQRHAGVVGDVQRRARGLGFFAIFVVESNAVVLV